MGKCADICCKAYNSDFGIQKSAIRLKFLWNDGKHLLYHQCIRLYNSMGTSHWEVPMCPFLGPHCKMVPAQLAPDRLIVFPIAPDHRTATPFSGAIKRNATVKNWYSRIYGKGSPFMLDLYCRLSVQTGQWKQAQEWDCCTQGLIAAILHCFPQPCWHTAWQASLHGIEFDLFYNPFGLLFQFFPLNFFHSPRWNRSIFMIIG